MIRRAIRDGREARGNEEREKERFEKGSREGIEKETKRQFEENEGLREKPPLLEFLDLTLRCSHHFFKSTGYDKLELKHQNLFLQAYRKHYLKKCHGVKQNAKKNVPLVKQNLMKLEVFILGRQRIDQRRKKGWRRGRRERIEKGSRERIEIERKETKGN